MKPKRLKLLIAYDGRPFTGWQSQAAGNGIQDHIERALAKLVGTPVRIHGSGRTDAGVHALGQVAHFEEPPQTRTTALWQIALNANLPPEIRILKVTRMPGTKQGFHARYSATGKRYTYRIWNDRFLHPFELGRAWLVPYPLDLATLRAAAAVLVGRHDFAGFAANRGEPDESTIRTVSDIRIAKRGPLITFTFEGEGFLYKMVRLLTGSLIRVGQGRGDLAWLHAILSGAKKSNHCAPPDGLCLAKVFY